MLRLRLVSKGFLLLFPLRNHGEVISSISYSSSQNRTGSKLAEKWGITSRRLTKLNFRS